MAVAALLGAGGYVVWDGLIRNDHGPAQRAAAARRFVVAWERRDARTMWLQLTPRAQATHPLARFEAAYKSADTAAGVRAVRAGRLGSEHGGRITVRVAIRTDDFGTLRGVLALPVSGKEAKAGVDWTTAQRLPGLRAREDVQRKAGESPARGDILDAAGTLLDATGAGASIAGTATGKPTGLQRLYDDRLGGHPSERLLFGDRQIAKVPAVRGRSIRTTIRPGLMAKAQAALGSKLGGIAVLRPRDGAVLALAGLAVSAPQPPGSTFKMITVSEALKRGVATPTTSYPTRTFATLSGVKLRNASGESCGGTLTQAFIDSCNSVFAPLGAKLGAQSISGAAHAFGFGETPKIPAVKPSTIGTVAQLRDDLAVGAASIGQDRDLATPLEMASVGATIAEGGKRARPRIVDSDPVVRHVVIPEKVAHQVREMMLGVVRSGTGTAAAIPGVEVAGKTGTAELVANSTSSKSSDAWFVAFAPAQNPKVAVAVMLVGAGFGGSSAAPIARKVLIAALQG
jgi:cell division protein FtsI/penicillin-binding protein 2